MERRQSLCSSFFGSPSSFSRFLTSILDIRCSIFDIRYLVLAFLLASSLLAADLSVVSIPSPSMKRTYQATVILPQSYASDGKRYSVIYFLHGYSGDHTTWPRVAPLERYVDSCRVIAVCPDGRYRSWYLDSPAKKLSRFDTYVTREIPAFVDSVYRTHASTQGRAIMGSSMGGHGALTLLARHPEVYCGAVSVSGIMDLREFPDQWEIADVLGPYGKNQARWKEYSFVGLAPKLVGVNKWIALDCGTEDFALDGNRRTHALLTELKIPHGYAEHPGGHTPLYVRGVALTHIMELSKVLLKPE